MSELLSQLGIDWKLLLSQAANFLILLTVLRIFAYKPLMKLMQDRRARIEEGLTHADEADKRLAESNEVMRAKMKEAEHEAVVLMQATEHKAKEKEAEMLAETHKKEEKMLAEADLIIKAKAEDMKKKVEAEAAMLVKTAIAKTVEMKPETIDAALVETAIQSLKGR